jgi:UDP:flavonoid glycosyltransferase YjiC (YdhE family)
MARYLIGWEFGAGLGHVSPIAEFARRLGERGHEVHAVSADAYASATAFGNFRIPVYALPEVRKPRKPFRSTRSLAEVLYNLGYHSSTALAVRLAAWRDLIDAIRPDVLIVNYAPTAILAARDRPVRVLQFGTGFAMPPAEVPVPGFSLLGSVSEKRLQASEAGVLGKINRALKRVGMPEISDFKETFTADRDVLVTLRELDHYPERLDGDYAGPLVSATFDDAPTWPHGRDDMPRIFCYLKAGHRGFARMVESIAALDARVLIYAAGLDAARRRDLSTDRLCLASRPVDLKQACGDSDVVVCHGGHGTVAMAMLSDARLLLLPEKSHAEQWMNAKNVARLGAGEVVAPAMRREDIRNAVDRVMARSNRPGAETFRLRYRDFDSDSAWRALMGAAEELAACTTPC